MIYTDVDSAYLSLCKQLLDAPHVGNTREILNAHIQIENPCDSVVSIRDISIEYLFGELIWYLTARNDLEFISKFSTFWNHLSDDGETCNSAYGYIIADKHGFNQLAKVMELLHEDPTSRRAVININVPNEHVIETKDEPCTVSIQFLLRDNKVHCTTYMRSNDIWLGFPYDVVFFTELQRLVAVELGADPGTYTHFVGSLHMYDKDVEKIKRIVEYPDPRPVVFDHEALWSHAVYMSEMIMTSNNPRRELREMLRWFNIYNVGGTE